MKPPSPYRKTHRRRGGNRLEERATALFALGLALFSPLVIRIFDRGATVTVFGIPLLYVYVFLAWAGLLALLALVMEAARFGRDVPPATESSRGQGGSPLPRSGARSDRGGH